MPYPPLVATDSTDSHVYPLDFQTIHERGIPHRAVQVEIVNKPGLFFTWHRTDGRLEIPGGHVDWLEDQNRPESYEEAALREIIEEFNLLDNWKIEMNDAVSQLKKHLSPILRLINQLPSSHGNNNEWVTVFKLDWQVKWGDPCQSEWKLSSEGYSPEWLSLKEIKQHSLENPMGINASLRHFLRRRNILVPLTSRSFEKQN